MNGIFSRYLLASNIVLALLLPVGVVSAQTPEKVTQPATVASPAASVETDYLVRVGKHTMWKSQVSRMHPTLTEKVVPISRKNGNDFQVLVGKQTVWASSIRRDPKAKTRPSSHSASCTDFPVEIGKNIVWASAAQCPMGKHTKDAKPLCCVAPLGEMSKMPKCCADAAK